MATLEAAVGLMEPARTGREVEADPPVEMDPDYDTVHGIESERSGHGGDDPYRAGKEPLRTVLRKQYRAAELGVNLSVVFHD